MKATQMEFRVASPQVLKGIAHGDRVQAQLVKKEGGFVIIDLRQPIESSD